MKEFTKAQASQAEPLSGKSPKTAPGGEIYHDLFLKPCIAVSKPLVAETWSGFEWKEKTYEFQSWVLGFPYQTGPASYQGR